ncbi:MAG: tetratricopeptide repeat protein [Alphaproteobacteria bacterium]|nr:tetratricopeptide repeat protein [Alphaproteobacteria bacterium]
MAAGPAVSAGSSDNGDSGGSSVSKNVDANYAAGRKATEAKDWARAIPLFQKAVATDPKNADAYNLLGYSQRHVGNYEAALKSYNQALAINPKHKGAHEYIGEAYLKMGNVSKAEEHLKALDDICFFGCEEFTELKEKIADFRAGKKG